MLGRGTTLRISSEESPNEQTEGWIAISLGQIMGPYCTSVHDYFSLDFFVLIIFLHCQNLLLCFGERRSTVLIAIVWHF